MILNCAARKSIESKDLLAEMKGLTVGEKFIVQCSGDLSTLQTESLRFLPLNAQDPTPALTLLQVIQKQDTQLELLVTSYRVGPHTSKDVHLVDGLQVFDMEGFSWEITSVIQQQDPQKPIQPFPSYPGWQMSYPIWMYGLFILLLVLIILLPLHWIRKIKAYKKSYEKLKDYQSVLLPLDAFYKELRKHEKNFDLELKPNAEIKTDLERELRLFLTRELQIPAVDEPLPWVLKEMKHKNFRVYRNFSSTLSHFFRELHSGGTEKKDLVYFFERIQKIVDAIDFFVNKNKKTTARGSSI